MKIILSRKGFDSKSGGCASPIMPDGTLLSMPIPEPEGVRYNELAYNGTSYAEILKDLNPKERYEYAHLDPDIRDGVRIKGVPEWKPAFGQVKQTQSQLENAGVEPGDIFLFFGWFKQADTIGGKYRFVPGAEDLHVIYGYMQIGEILTNQRTIENYAWHPHASSLYRKTTKNTLYIPTARLSLVPNKKGYGVLDWREDRVLTKKGDNNKRATWKALDFLMPQHVYGDKTNSAKNGLFYNGRWQELVVYESPGLIDWVRGLLSDDAVKDRVDSPKETVFPGAEEEKEELPGKPKVKPGSTVRHYKYGIGTVKRIERDIIYVSFAGEEKKFQYPFVVDNNYMTPEG